MWVKWYKLFWKLIKSRLLDINEVVIVFNDLMLVLDKDRLLERKRMIEIIKDKGKVKD